MFSQIKAYHMLPKETITVYTTSWGKQCQSIKTFLKEEHIPFEVIDIQVEKQTIDYFNEIEEKPKVLPAIKIDGIIHHNPQVEQLKDWLGINASGDRITMLGAGWCPDCHRAKAYLGDHDVKYRYIDIDQASWAPSFLEKVNNGKRIIPTIMINNEVYANPDNRQLKDLLNLPDTNSGKLYDVAIIGAGAAGLTAAIYVQRDRYDAVVIERKNIGGNAYLTEKIENYPGFMDISGPELMEKMAEQAKFYGADLRLGTDVRKINKVNNLFYLETNLGEIKAKSVIIATGSSYRKLKIPGESELIGKGVHFCATCDGAFYKDREVIVVGGGNSALEEGIFLTRFAKKVKFVHRSPQFKADATYIEKLQEMGDHVALLLDHTPIAFSFDEEENFIGLKTKHNQTGEETLVTADGAFIFIGLVPNSKSFKNLVDLDANGFMMTNEDGFGTSTPGIFAAGDVRHGAIAQVAAATGEGVAASYAVKHYLRRLHG